MSPQEALKAHLARRPELPRPYDPASKAARDHQRALQEWVDQLERLESAVRLQGFALEPKDQLHRCLPKADYIYREPMGRKRNRAAEVQRERERRTARKAAVKHATREAMDECLRRKAG